MPPHALRTESGLAYKVLEPGSGTRCPGASERMRIASLGLDAERGDVPIVLDVHLLALVPPRP